MDMVTRIDQERREHELLAPWAAFSDASAGRATPVDEDPLRTCYQRDRDKILHSKSFRRLANKTQVFLAPEGDHYRTRLTHTLEVSQIARSIARPLGLNEDLVEAIALGHDLGHTPFGHCGERALAERIARVRGIDPASDQGKACFRHNEQSVRIVELLEGGGQGLNLTREVVDGMLNHTGGGKATTCEGQVVARADRIAYVTHDIDDAERAGLLSEDTLPDEFCDVLGHGSSERITTMVEDVVRESARCGQICMSELVEEAMMGLRGYLFDNLYSKGEAKTEEPKAAQMIGSLFDYYVAHPDEIPDEYRIHGEGKPWVQAADYVSSMTDRYAIRTFTELCVPHAWALHLQPARR